MKLARSVFLICIAACASERKPETLRSGTLRPQAIAGDAQVKSTEATQAQATSTPSTPQPASEELTQVRALLDEASAALKASDYALARAKAEKATNELLLRPESERDEEWVRALDSAGRAADDAQDSQTAQVAWKQVMEIRSRTLPPDHHDLQAARGNFARTLFAQGDLDGARALVEQVLEVYSRTLPPDHPDIQAGRLSLAAALYVQGDLSAARALVEEVLEVYSRTLPPEHELIQAARMNLAATLYTQGDLPAARAVLEQVHEVFSRTLPPDHPNLQKSRTGLANTLADQGELAAARALQEQVLEVYSRTLPPEHSELQRARMNLAATLADQGNFRDARVLQEQVLEVYSRTLPTEDPDHQAARLNLAATLYGQGDLPAARALLDQVLEVYSRTLPPDDSHLQAARGNLASVLVELAVANREEEEGEGRRKGERVRERYTSLVHSLAKSSTRTARAAMLSSSSREAEERCSSLQDALSSTLSFAAGYGVFDPDPSLTREAFVLSETTRASAFASARITRLASSNERYPALTGEIQAADEELASLAQSGSTPEAYDKVLARRDRAQRDLVQLASGSRGETDLLAVPDPDVLSAQLSETDAIVAFRRYTRWEIPSGETSARSTESLCAFVLRRGAGIQRVDLGAIESIEIAVKSWRDELGVGSGRGIGPGVHVKDSQTESRVAGQVAAFVLEPLRASLSGVHRLLVVPDDVLYLVPIDALPIFDADRSGTPGVSAPGKAILLGDRWEIEYRSTVQEILSKSATPLESGLVLAVGGADYSAAPTLHAADRERAIAAASHAEPGTQGIRIVPAELRGGAWGDGFPPLPATIEEAQGIAALARQGRESGEIVPLFGSEASRESIQSLAHKTRFLHLATHGWFVRESVRGWSDPEPRDKRGNVIARMSAEERIKGSSPMLLCGLALAGANLPADAIGRYPGLITAEEVSGWDLSNCELAVLSACDTNVGERRAGQGVESLQKALHMAGARTVITSLWKVPDEATKELMLEFYRRIWIEREPKAKALWEAKKKLCEAKDERGQPKYSTRDWAAWVLTGDPN